MEPDQLIISISQMIDEKLDSFKAEIKEWFREGRDEKRELREKINKLDTKVNSLEKFEETFNNDYKPTIKNNNRTVIIVSALGLIAMVVIPVLITKYIGA